MDAGELALILGAFGACGALLTGGAAWIKARSEKRTPERTVAIVEVEAALKVLGETIDRLEAANRALHIENDQLQALVAQLRAEVERLRRLVEPGGVAL